MNRRQFLIGTAALGGVALVSPFQTALAQDAEATPKPYQFKFDGFEVGAMRNFTATGMRLDGGMKYGFSVEIFDKDDHAKDAFEKFDEYVEGYFDYVKSQTQATMGELQEVSAPKLGKDRIAKTTVATIEGMDFDFVMMFAFKDDKLHKWFGVGLANPAEELFDLADKLMKFDDVDKDNDEEIWALLPTLDDMPVGFVLEEEILKHKDDK